MEKSTYQKLARHLDNLPGGFPPTETGVELRILKRLFTPEEADLALHLEADTITLNLDRCIGCGLCVSTCPTESIRLVRKPESEQPKVPKDIVQTLIQLGKTRGRLTTPGLMKMMVKSKVDRLLTLGN